MALVRMSVAAVLALCTVTVLLGTRADAVQTAASTDSCTPGTLISDQFDRGDGGLGVNWTQAPRSSVLSIVDQQACGYFHGGALFDQLLTAGAVRVSFDVTATASSEFEAFALFQAEGGLIYFAGYVQGRSGPGMAVVGRVVDVGDTETLATGASATFSANTVYHLEASFDGSNLAVEIRDPDGASMTQANAAVVETMQGAGFVVGRSFETVEACADNFRVDEFCPPTPTPTSTPTSTVTRTPTSTPTPTPSLNPSDCEESASTAGSPLASDDFNRDNGALGASWQTGLNGFSAPQIAGQLACGYYRSVGLYDQDISGPHVRVSFDFQSSSNRGFEVFAIGQTSGGDAYYAGCDGSTSGQCKPIIGVVVGSDPPLPLTIGPGIPLTRNVAYRLQAFFDNGNIHLRILDSSDTLLGEQTWSTGATFLHYGVAIGRDLDSLLTCIDDFLIEALCVATPTPTATATPTASATATATSSATATSTATASPSSTPSATSTATASPTATSTASPTPTPSSTASPTAMRIVVDAASAFAGSSRVSGASAPECDANCRTCDGRIHVFDCGTEDAPTCYDARDIEIATCPKAAGTYDCLLQVPLRSGQLIYAVDGCFDPARMAPSDAVAVAGNASVPTLSPMTLLELVLLLGGVGAWGARRL